MKIWWSHVSPWHRNIWWLIRRNLWQYPRRYIFVLKKIPYRWALGAKDIEMR